MIRFVCFVSANVIARFCIVVEDDVVVSVSTLWTLVWLM